MAKEESKNDNSDTKAIEHQLSKTSDDNSCKVTSPLIPSEMIAKLERIQSTAKQNKRHSTKPPQTMGATTNNDKKTDPPPYNGQQPKPLDGRGEA